MEPYSLCFFSIFLISMNLLYQPSNCQQIYPSIQLKNCSESPSKSNVSKGYLCDGPAQTPCLSFVAFRSQPPYDSPTSIAHLLNSEAFSIALINNISSNDEKLPSETQVIVPISCSCSGSFYQHNAPYIIKENDTSFAIANNTYQGLTSCQALRNRNNYSAISHNPGSELMVPLRCACPSRNQIANGVSSLLTYTVTRGDTFQSIANLFGVDEKSILEANMLLQNSSIYPDTPLLIPLKRDSCNKNPKNLYCHCPHGFVTHADREGLNCKSEGKKFPIKLVTLLGAGIVLGFLCMFLLGYNLCKFLRKRRYQKQKQKWFRENGGFFLQQRLSSHGRSDEAKIFSPEELEIATDKYNQSRFLGKGGFGTVYKGMLQDGKIVAVKKSNAIDRSQIEQFINEVLILSQINHRNIVKLLGCCLETEIPILVYEFIPNGTLSHHIHDHQQEEHSSLSWEHRLRIACEVAGAVAYMHSAASIPIFHRDIKSSNILLDEKYSAKVSDFGTSRSIPHDKTHLTTAVRGTLGYLDPEYFNSGQFTDKSDVYSFGVVLVELLTGKRPICFAIADEETNPVAYFISLAKENQLLKILDTRVAEEAKEEEIYAIAEVATRCLISNGKKRPTMKEVAIELEGLRRSQKCLEISQEPQLLKDVDQTALVHSARGTGQESKTGSLVFPLEMEYSTF